MKIFQDKKGVSPLVATLLLILFSVGLGAGVMVLGETYIGEHADFALGVPEIGEGCELASFSITTIRGVEHICVKDDTIDASLDNGQNTPIDDFHVKIHGSEGVSNVQNLLKNPLGKNEGVRLKIPYNYIGKPLKIILTPIKEVSGNSVYCASKSLQTETLPNCE
ncbi:hypothetical protein HY837_05680 [archaeon]|nr:hypothetical protein [archaeon]